jgi:hypothetical protein
MISSKSINNGSEEVVELILPNVTPQNRIYNRSTGYIQAEITAILADTSIAVTDEGVSNASTNWDGSLPALKDEPNELPYIARNLTWHDPFYENSHDINDIIMAFDIDRTKYDYFCGLLFWQFLL